MLALVPMRISHDRLPVASVCDIFVWNKDCSKLETVALSHTELGLTPGHSWVKDVMASSDPSLEQWEDGEGV